MRVQTEQQGQIDFFRSKLDDYKNIIDARIASFVPAFEAETAEQFGNEALTAVATFTDYLRRGGKRIRGALTMVGYELFGGQDQAMILDAALAIEMLQSYILMLDDIQDRSEIRRGGPSAHMILKAYHEHKKFRDDPLHFGESIALNASIVACHAALDIITHLNVDPASLLRALSNVHRCYITTGNGQTLDIFNEVQGTTDEKNVDNVLIWKTAYYTFVNPLQFGAILAGAQEKDLRVLYDYSIPAGRAFQITDDILGIYGEEFESGKSPLDDIKEGKRTILATKALELADAAHVYYLEQCLGKHDLTMDEFVRCRNIIKDSGALAYAQQEARIAAEEAIVVLNSVTGRWENNVVQFLKGLVEFLLSRKA